MRKGRGTGPNFQIQKWLWVGRVGNESKRCEMSTVNSLWHFGMYIWHTDTFLWYERIHELHMPAFTYITSYTSHSFATQSGWWKNSCHPIHQPEMVRRWRTVFRDDCGLQIHGLCGARQWRFYCWFFGGSQPLLSFLVFVWVLSFTLKRLLHKEYREHHGTRKGGKVSPT